MNFQIEDDPQGENLQLAKRLVATRIQEIRKPDEQKQQPKQQPKKEAKSLWLTVRRRYRKWLRQPIDPFPSAMHWMGTGGNSSSSFGHLTCTSIRAYPGSRWSPDAADLQYNGVGLTYPFRK